MPDNEYIFPQPDVSTEGRLAPFGGLTLRDWFAGQAIAGTLGANIPTDWSLERSVNATAGAAYALADAMLRARRKS